MKYRIALDNSKNIMDELPTIEASSPKEAAEKYAGGKVARVTSLSGDIVVQSTQRPYRMYLYNRS